MTVIPMDDSPPALAPRAAPVTGAALTLSFGLLLGLGVQGGVLLAMAAQDQLPQAARLVADAVQLLAWTTLACIALVASRAVGRAHPVLALLPGLVLVPVAVIAARVLQIETLAALTGGDVHAALPWLDAAIKAGEFALLGGVLWLLARERAGGLAHVLAGVGLGALACAVLGVLRPDATALPGLIIELAVPAGAAAVVFLVGKLARDAA